MVCSLAHRLSACAVAAMSNRRLTSPCSRRAAARPGTRRGMDEPRPAAEGQLVSWPLAAAESET